MSLDQYQGPQSISWAVFPGRGRSYRIDLEGHAVELSVSEKGQRVRVFVDGKERK